jgi:hypothetical protein
MLKLESLLRNPLVLVSTWLMYCLLLLAWFSYRDALKGWLCLN